MISVYFWGHPAQQVIAMEHGRRICSACGAKGVAATDLDALADRLVDAYAQHTEVRYKACSWMKSGRSVITTATESDFLRSTRTMV